MVAKTRVSSDAGKTDNEAAKEARESLKKLKK
jgi:hypothetical protein